MSEWKDNHIENLPDCFAKSTDSNNYKILEIEKRTVNEFRDNLQEIYNSLDLDLAFGATLDLYGELVGQERGRAGDDQYRMMIKAKIFRNLSNGSLPSIVDSLARTLNCDKSKIIITESDKPCTVANVQIPIEIINNADWTTSQTTALIKALLPVGITLEDFLYEGTFEFGSGESDYDEEKGFANEAGTIGGYFGAAAGGEVDFILPI